MSATNRFNHYMNTHFSGCVLLMQMLDAGRGRTMSFYQIPGEWDLAGITDGTDSFVVPTTTADPTSAKLKKILEDLRNGKQPEITPLLRRRAVAAPEAAAQASNGPSAPLQRRTLAAPPPAPAAGLQRRPLRS